MTFDRHYPRRKDIRRRYYGSKQFDRSCRPGGGCPWCRLNRAYKSLLANVAWREQRGVIR